MARTRYCLRQWPFGELNSADDISKGSTMDRKVATVPFGMGKRRGGTTAHVNETDQSQRTLSGAQALFVPGQVNLENL